MIDDEGDDLDERELAALNAAISRSLDQAARGEVADLLGAMADAEVGEDG